MSQWKYMLKGISATEKNQTLEEQLNHYGNESWEVVSVWPEPSTSNSGSLQVLFKRQSTLEEPKG